MVLLNYFYFCLWNERVVLLFLFLNYFVIGIIFIEYDIIWFKKVVILKSKDVSNFYFCYIFNMLFLLKYNLIGLVVFIEYLK